MSTSASSAAASIRRAPSRASSSRLIANSLRAASSAITLNMSRRSFLAGACLAGVLPTRSGWKVRRVLMPGAHPQFSTISPSRPKITSGRGPRTAAGGLGRQVLAHLRPSGQILACLGEQLLSEAMGDLVEVDVQLFEPVLEVAEGPADAVRSAEVGVQAHGAAVEVFGVGVEGDRPLDGVECGFGIVSFLVELG